MNSVEKTYYALEELADLDDQEMNDAMPVRGIPLPMVRSLIPVISRSVPEDPAELDHFFSQVIEFISGLRSDPVEETTNA